MATRRLGPGTRFDLGAGDPRLMLPYSITWIVMFGALSAVLLARGSWWGLLFVPGALMGCALAVFHGRRYLALRGGRPLDPPMPGRR